MSEGALRPPGDRPIDLELVRGLSFQCRPGCALCCYTNPAVSDREATRLLRIAPSVQLIAGPGGFRGLAARPRGGACCLLATERCTLHAARPFPCRQFPLSVHAGDRVQLSVVLSCPGVEFRPRLAANMDGPSPSDAPGFRDELAAVRQRLETPHGRATIVAGLARRAATIRALEARGLWESEEHVRARVGARLDRWREWVGAPSDLPGPTAPLEALPLVFDPDLGRLLFRRSGPGLEFLTVQETGGAKPIAGVFAAGAREGALETAAERLLTGYLRYALDRDQLFGYVHHELRRGREGSIERLIEQELGRIARAVCARGQALRELHRAGSGPLKAEDIEAGIRATDLDFLDRPTASGVRL